MFPFWAAIFIVFKLNYDGKKIKKEKKGVSEQQPEKKIQFAGKICIQFYKVLWFVHVVLCFWIWECSIDI